MCTFISRTRPREEKDEAAYAGRKLKEAGLAVQIDRKSATISNTWAKTGTVHCHSARNINTKQRRQYYMRNF